MSRLTPFSRKADSSGYDDNFGIGISIFVGFIMLLLICYCSREEIQHNHVVHQTDVVEREVVYPIEVMVLAENGGMRTATPSEVLYLDSNLNAWDSLYVIVVGYITHKDLKQDGFNVADIKAGSLRAATEEEKENYKIVEPIVEYYHRAINKTGSVLKSGQRVYPASAEEGLISIAIPKSKADSIKIMGYVCDDISDGTIGYVRLFNAENQ